MSEYGISKSGFYRKPYYVIKNEVDAKTRELFGENVDLSVYSPIGLFSELLSWQSHLLWQELEDTYYAHWIDTAEGVNLERSVLWGGLSRNSPKKAVITEMVFAGEAGVEIETGKKVQTTAGIQFATTKGGTISADGDIALPCQAVLAGAEGNVQEGTVIELVDAIEGVSSVYNRTQGIGGTDLETDMELRNRYTTEGAESAGCGVDSIRDSLLNLTDVTTVSVYENTEITTVDGRPPKSIECVVAGGNAADIAEAIFRSKAAGIATYGDEVIPVEDDQGKMHNIYFNRPYAQYIYVRATVAFPYVNEDSLSDEGLAALTEDRDAIKDKIEKNIESYINSLKPGENIYQWKLIAINSNVNDVENLEIEMAAIDSDDPSPAYQDIIIDSYSDFTTDITFHSENNLSLSVVVSETENISIDIDFLNAEGNILSWSDIISQVNTDLGAFASAAYVTYDEEGVTVNAIRISTAAAGEGQTISVSDGVVDGLISAVNNTETAGMQFTLGRPIDGRNGYGRDAIIISDRSYPKFEKLSFPE